MVKEKRYEATCGFPGVVCELFGVSLLRYAVCVIPTYEQYDLLHVVVYRSRAVPSPQ